MDDNSEDPPPMEVDNTEASESSKNEEEDNNEDPPPANKNEEEVKDEDPPPSNTNKNEEEDNNEDLPPMKVEKAEPASQDTNDDEETEKEETNEEEVKNDEEAPAVGKVEKQPEAAATDTKKKQEAGQAKKPKVRRSTRTAGRKRTRKDETETAKKKPSFYAVQPSAAVKEPVIFFGQDDFEWFETLAKVKADGAELQYQVFHKLADALEFIDFDDTDEVDNDSKTQRKRSKRTKLPLASQAAAKSTPKAKKSYYTPKTPEEKAETWIKYWYEKYELLRQYHEEFGHCNVATTGPNEEYRRLGRWVRTQREEYKAGNLTEERKQRLLDLGFVLDLKAKKWEDNYELLKDYKEEHEGDFSGLFRNNTLVAKYKPLKLFAKVQRQQLVLYDKNPSAPQMTADQREKLMGLGFIPATFEKLDEEDEKVKESLREATWQEKFQLLQEYKAEFGDFARIFHSSTLAPKYKPLYRFAKSQREQLRLYDSDPAETKLTADQTEQLLELGFTAHDEGRDSSRHDASWEEKFELLKEYKAQHGDCNVRYKPDMPEKYKPLARWVQRQQDQVRAMENSGGGDLNRPFTITPERRKRLTDLGFSALQTWEAAWEEKFNLLKEYKAEYGDCNIRGLNIKGKYAPLGSWAQRTRQDMKIYDAGLKEEGQGTGRMTAERRQRLSEIGFSPLTLWEDIWEKKFNLLTEYKNEYGHCNVPTHADWPGLKDKYKPLAKWLMDQRKHIRDKAKALGPTTIADDQKLPSIPITGEQERRLRELGVEPGRQAPTRQYESAFRKRIKELEAFKEKHGHANAPWGHTLYHWIRRIRKDYYEMEAGKETGLKLEHIIKLTSLGVSLAKRKVSDDQDRAAEYVDFVKTQGRFPAPLAKDANENRLANAAIKWRTLRKQHAQGIEKCQGRTTEIAQDVIDALDSVNFRWQTKTKKHVKKPNVPWEERFESLKAFSMEHGHCEPPRNMGSLSNFVRTQRREYKCMVEGKRSALSVDRFRKLSEIGFRFKPKQIRTPRKKTVDSNGHDGATTDGGDDTADEQVANNDAEDTAVVFGTPRRSRNQPAEESPFGLALRGVKSPRFRDPNDDDDSRIV